MSCCPHVQVFLARSDQLLPPPPSLPARAVFIGAGYLSLTGNLACAVSSVAATHPILLFPFKFAIAYTLLYHYVGAIRHFVWDHHSIGNQADKNSLLEVPSVEMLSKGIFVAAGVLAFIAACM